MATATLTNTTLRNNTAIIKLLHDGLISVGLVQTSDSGQLNLSSASPAYVSTASYAYGYTVYRWNDAYQATYPLYIRLDWANSSGTSRLVHPRVSLGTGSDGAGNITGLIYQSALASVSPSDATSNPSFVSMVNGALSIALTPGAAGSGDRFFIFIDRLRTLAGDTASGVWLSVNPGFSYLTDVVASADRTSVYISGNQANNISYTNLPPFFLPFPATWSSETGNLLAADGDVPFFPQYILTPKAYSTLNQIAVPASEIAYNTNFAINRFGSNRTYKALSSNMPVMTGFFGSNVRFGLAMLWE